MKIYVTQQEVLLPKTGAGTCRGCVEEGSGAQNKQQIKKQGSVSFYTQAWGQADHYLPRRATDEPCTRLGGASHLPLKFNFISSNSRCEPEYLIKGFRH